MITSIPGRDIVGDSGSNYVDGRGMASRDRDGSVSGSIVA
jgi:hypothetical protein